MKIKLLPYLSLILLLGASSCSDPESAGDESQGQSSKEKKSRNEIEITFTYGSEKDKWIKALTTEFNRVGHEVADGRKVRVNPIPMGSGECVGEIVQSKRETHIVSPASAVFIKLGNADSMTATGKPLVNDTVDLVLSPVMIAMWKPMAEALGWPEKALGWKDIHEMALNQSGWESLGFPQWGQFRFGHTHPEYSNSGIISLFAETYAAAGKERGLTLEDVANPKVGDYLEEIEGAIVHYGRSTGFFGRKMFSTGPEYLSAAVLYENMVIESYDKELPFPVVAIYPVEGTFYSDHPIGIVERDYVTAAHREGAEKYIDFLTAPEQQERAMEFGFRPADVSISLNEKFSGATGTDPAQPQTTLEVPNVEVADAVLELWKQRKKKSNLALVLDISGSMRDEKKLTNAKVGASKLIELLGESDQFSLLTFNNEPLWLARDKPVGNEREQINRQIQSLFANGGTALYDAVSEATNHLKEADLRKKITAIVVLTDGEDTDSQLKFKPLLDQIGSVDEKSGGIRIFTIGYGRGARAEVLEEIASRTQGKYYKGNTDNIEDIFRDISTFF